MDTKLRPLLEAVVAEGKLPAVGAILTNANGDVLLRETCGTNNVALADAPKFDADTLMPIASCTKLVASIAALQLVEDGKLSLTDLAEQYVPGIAKLQVLDSLTDDDPPKPALRKPKTSPTVQQLLNHTIGIAYDFFDTKTLKWRLSTDRAPSQYYAQGDLADFECPYLADPGTKWIYGLGIDWAGMVIEAITGLKLDEYIEKHILEPLEMHSTVSAAKVGPDVERLVVHFKMDGKLIAAPHVLNAVNPVVRGGGGYLFSTLNDWMKLMAAILNDGTSPKTGRQILKPETIRNHVFTDEIPHGVDRSELGEIVSSVPALSGAGSFLPSIPVASRGWSCGGLLINQEDLPFGRKAGSGAWAGLMNLYYWIDPTSKLAGMVCTSVLPFMDPAVLRIFDELERIAYGHETSGDGDNVVRNYALQAAA